MPFMSLKKDQIVRKKRLYWKTRPISIDKSFIYIYIYIYIYIFLNNWTDAQHPVPRLWIRSGEVRGWGVGDVVRRMGTQQ